MREGRGEERDDGREKIGRVEREEVGECEVRGGLRGAFCGRWSPATASQKSVTTGSDVAKTKDGMGMLMRMRILGC